MDGAMQCNAIQRGAGFAYPSILSMARRKPADMRNMKKSHQHRVTAARKKPGRPFADTLSPEAREAMQSTKADEVAGKESVPSSENGVVSNKLTESGAEPNSSKSARSESCDDNVDQKNEHNGDDVHSRPKSDTSCKMADIYDQFSPCSGPERDVLTIEDADILNQHVIKTARGHIRAIGGGKVVSAMETVEVVVADEPPDYVTQPTDDEISAEMKRASVEKCLVWMEANERMQGQSSVGEAKND